MTVTMPLSFQKIKFLFSSGITLLSLSWIMINIKNLTIPTDGLNPNANPFNNQQLTKLQYRSFESIGKILQRLLLDQEVAAGEYRRYGGPTPTSSTSAAGSDEHKKAQSIVITKLKQTANYSCPAEFSFAQGEEVRTFICNAGRGRTKHELVLLTTMFYSDRNLYIFRNTLRVVASMMKDQLNVKPVMFIEDTNSFLQANAEDFIVDACNLGWTVLLAPHCNEYGYPVFKSMFDVAMSTWDAEWYGYSNADILFDDSLMRTIRFIQEKEDAIKIPMLVGRRYILAVSARHFS